MINKVLAYTTEPRPYEVILSGVQISSDTTPTLRLGLSTHIYHRNGTSHRLAILFVLPLCSQSFRACFKERGSQVPALLLGEQSWLPQGLQTYFGWQNGETAQGTKRKSPRVARGKHAPEEPPRVDLGSDVASKIEIDLVEIKGDQLIFNIYNGNEDCYADIITIEFRSPDGKSASKEWKYYISPLETGPGQFQVGAVAKHPLENIKFKVLKVKGRTVEVVEKATEEWEVWTGNEDEPKAPRGKELGNDQLQKLLLKTEYFRNSVRLDIENQLDGLTITEIQVLVPAPKGGRDATAKKSKPFQQNTVAR